MYRASKRRGSRKTRGVRALQPDPPVPPGGRRVVTASVDSTARVWNATSNQVIATLWDRYGGGQIASAAFSPDGQRIVTAGDDGRVLIFKVVTLDDIARLLAPS